MLCGQTEDIFNIEARGTQSRRFALGMRRTNVIPYIKYLKTEFL